MKRGESDGVVWGLGIEGGSEGEKEGAAMEKLK